jgi:glycosyltransferase involved in cell wall biosynthesis
LKENPHASGASIIGIDATNLHSGGGKTHIMEILRHLKPEAFGISRVVVWGAWQTLQALPDESWLLKVHDPLFERGILYRAYWQLFLLSAAARQEGCSLLLIPGGVYAGGFRPVVTICQNLLPFDDMEQARYGFSLSQLRLKILRNVFGYAFRVSARVVFLSRFALEMVSRKLPAMMVDQPVIPHGISASFFVEPRPQRSIGSCTPEDPFRMIYVSTIDLYKHQWKLVEAVQRVRSRHGWSITLDLVGEAISPAIDRLREAISLFDPGGEFVQYHGAVDHARMPALYRQADMAVFASSCENQPLILLEKMASGLPIACSDYGAMVEILGDDGVYFNPEDVDGMVEAITRLIEDPTLRESNARRNHARASRYAWSTTATETFSLLAEVIREEQEIKTPGRR